MELELAPDWVATVSRFNPLTWTLDAGREALGGGGDLTLISSRLALVALLTVAAAAVATRAFRSYQQSI